MRSAATCSHHTPLRGYLPAIHLAGSTRWPRRIARMSLICFFLLVLGVWFLPWQQSVSGTGRVIAFDPLDRRIDIQAPVSGVVRKLHVVEGQMVRKGDIIVEVQDNDPHLLTNLNLQRDALIARQAAAKQRVEDLDIQVRQLERAKGEAQDAARQRVLAERITAETAVLNHDRLNSLLKSKLVSQRDFEVAVQMKESSTANLKSAEATERRTENDFDSMIAGIRASRGTADAEVATATRDITALEVQINQNMRQTVTAPRGGMVLSVQATDGTYLRPGSPVCVIIPETESRYVELWLDGNDMPLVKQRIKDEQGNIIEAGSHVRVQFEGWPAVQFVGWPSVAIGTFGAEVVFIDAVDDGKGKFRLVIEPKPDVNTRDGQTATVPWPNNRYLRQGVRANGWVLLSQVPLWKEIWRQLNGFPPVVAREEPKKAGT